VSQRGSQENLGLFFEVPERPEGVKGFAIEAKRWVVERTFVCLNFYRRVVMDYGHTTKVQFISCFWPIYQWLFGQFT